MPPCDGQTDEQTQGHSTYRASIASRVKNVRGVQFQLSYRNLSAVHTIRVCDTLVANTAREHGCHFWHPCSRVVYTGSVYRTEL